MNIFMLIAIGVLFFIIKKKADDKLDEATGEHWPTLEPLPVEEDMSAESDVPMESEKEEQVRRLIELLGGNVRKQKAPTAERPSPKVEETTAPPAPMPAKVMKKAPKPSPKDSSTSIGQSLRSPKEARRAFIYSEVIGRKHF